MKFICEKEKIIKALNSVMTASPKRTTRPILECILIQTNDNNIKLTTYDEETGIEYIINDVKVVEQGASAVNSVMFTEIIRRLPDSDISININDKNLLVIECEGSTYKLATQNPDDFPELPQINVENSIEIEEKTFSDISKGLVISQIIEFSPVQPENALLSIIITELGIVIDVRSRQSLNALYLIEVMLLGMFADSNFMQ